MCSDGERERCTGLTFDTDAQVANDYIKKLRRDLKYCDHVTRHNGLQKTIMQGMVAGKRSRGKPRQRSWEKDITDTFGRMAAASRVAEERHRFRRDIWVATS